MTITADVYAPEKAIPADDDARADDTEKLSVADLVQMFEDAEDATQTARALSERDRDYYDSIQLTAEELEVLKKRNQPPVIANAISPKSIFWSAWKSSSASRPRRCRARRCMRTTRRAPPRRCATSPRPRTTATSAQGCGRIC